MRTLPGELTRASRHRAGPDVAFSASTRPLVDRLGVLPGCRLLALGIALPGSDAWDVVPVQHDADVVIVGCDSIADIAELVPVGWRERRADGRLWLAYRKGRRDLTRDQLGAAVEGLGLTWFRQTAVDAIWSAIWFKHRSEFRTLHH